MANLMIISSQSKQVFSEIKFVWIASSLKKYLGCISLLLPRWLKLACQIQIGKKNFGNLSSNKEIQP